MQSINSLEYVKLQEFTTISSTGSPVFSVSFFSDSWTMRKSGKKVCYLRQLCQVMSLNLMTEYQETG